MRQRAAVLIIREGKILLLRRSKYGRLYYVVPGGGVENGETIEEAAIREIHEETGLQIGLHYKFWEYNNAGHLEHYFLATHFAGEPCLGGPEAERQSSQNIYRLEWVPLSKLDNIPLLPKPLIEQIFSLYSSPH